MVTAEAADYDSTLLEAGEQVEVRILPTMLARAHGTLTLDLAIAKSTKFANA
jgi:hypothetical protein